MHDRFLHNFLDTAKRTVLDLVLQLPAIDTNAYVRPIYIIVKLYPHISDRICVVGYLQNIPKIDGFDPQKLSGY